MKSKYNRVKIEITILHIFSEIVVGYELKKFDERERYGNYGTY